MHSYRSGGVYTTCCPSLLVDIRLNCMCNIIIKYLFMCVCVYTAERSKKVLTISVRATKTRALSAMFSLRNKTRQEHNNIIVIE